MRDVLIEKQCTDIRFLCFQQTRLLFLELKPWFKCKKIFIPEANLFTLVLYKCIK